MVREETLVVSFRTSISFSSGEDFIDVVVCAVLLDLVVEDVAES